MMKKYVALSIVAILLAGPKWGFAEESLVDKLKFEYAGFTFQTPLRDPSIAWIYDFVGKENLIAGEGSIITHEKIKNVSITFGGALDASNENDGELRDRARRFLKSGAPYFGLRYIYNVTQRLHIGAAYGRNIKEDRNIVGIKTDYQIRFK